MSLMFSNESFGNSLSSRSPRPRNSRPKESDLSLGTRNLLKSMMRTSKLTHSQQRYLDKVVTQGPVLPGHPTRDMHLIEMELFKSSVGPTRPTSLFDRPSIRTHSQILAAGSYDREQFRTVALKDFSVEKERLQQRLEGIESSPLKSSKPSKETRHNRVVPELDELDEFQTLNLEIQERRQWLDDMVALGRGQQYKRQIQSEIAERISKMEQIHRVKSTGSL